ncbi:MAG: 16S rRNA (adenine(1518)-N(6)/adenine(1519)-N(6))-dimethyltransferase RsmA [Patescibacteria group bacterium]
MKRHPLHRKGARLGQHFLTNPGIAANIAEAGRVRKGEVVLEVGPGKGILTDALLSKGARVVAIEKDTVMVSLLRTRFAQEIADGQLTLIEDDIRSFVQGPGLTHLVGLAETRVSAMSKTRVFDKRRAYKVVANIPYYITGELVRMFLTAKHQPTTIVFLVQKEVAERIVGNPEQRRGTRPKKESVLSLSVKAYGTPRYAGTVKAGSFSPPPSVDSAILAIEKISRKNFKTVSEESFFRVVKAGFAQKRKTLGGNLKKVFGERALVALTASGIAPTTRAEVVSLEGWLRLAREVSDSTVS